MEVDGVGAGGKGAVVVVRIEDLHGQRLPAAGRAAVSEARPALADGAKLLFDGRNQLVLDGVAVGADVGRVHGVGVVVVGIGVLDLDDEHAREAGRDPLLVELVGLLLLDAVVAGQVEALAVVGLQVRVGRGGAEVRRSRSTKWSWKIMSGKRALGCSSKPSGTSTMALKNMGRPQNLVSTAL